MRIKLPFVNSYWRYGRWHYQFRRKGVKKTTLKGRPGSANFVKHYAELLVQSEEAAKPVVRGQFKPGTINAVINRYVRSDDFKALAPTTQAARRRILDHFADFKTPSGRPYGGNQLRTMLEEHVTAVLEAKPATSKRDWLKAIRHWLRYAKSIGEVDVDVTVGITT